MIPTISKTDTVKSIEESTPFSFNNLYPGLGQVEDITKQYVTNPSDTKPSEVTKPNEINASVMKEVISLDKKEEKVDDTETLDNFFKDIQQLANPMEPIKEETKYTLFEDAVENE